MWPGVAVAAGEAEGEDVNLGSRVVKGACVATDLAEGLHEAPVVRVPVCGEGRIKKKGW